VNSALGGIEAFYDNYKKRDKLGMAIGAITFFSGIASATGNPIGGIIALVLNLIKTGLNIAKKENTKPTESDSDRLERIIRKALKDYRQTGLKAEWSGYQRLSDVFSSNVEFMASFNAESTTDMDADKLKDITDSKMGTLSEVKQAMFDAVVSRLYDVLMSSTTLLGRVQYELSQECDYEVKMTELKSKRLRRLGGKPEESTELNEEDDKEELAKGCLGLYELYSKMNYFREQKFMGHLNAIDQIMRNRQAASRLQFFGPGAAEDKTPKSKREAYAYKHLILDVIRQMNENNKDVFKPLTNAFTNLKYRYIINYYHTYSEKYEYLRAYMENLELDEEKLNDAMLCKKESLSGSCTRYLVGAATRAEIFDTRPFTFRSVFVPEGKKVRVWYKPSRVSIALQSIGPDVMSTMFYGQPTTNPVKEIEVSAYTQDEKIRIYKMCAKKEDKKDEKLRMHKAVCTEKEYDITQPTEIDINTLEDDQKWKGRPISIASQEKDLAITAMATVKIGGEDYKIRWGPFFSPYIMEEGCGSVLWEKIRTERYKSADITEEEQRKVSVLTNTEMCKGHNLLCQDKVIDKSFFLKICKEPELKDRCHYIPLIKGEASKTIDLKRIGVYIEKGTQDVSDTDLSDKNVDALKKAYNDELDDCNWFTRQVKSINSKERLNLLESMKIPNGLSVELYTEFGGQGEMFGPYDGPVTVDKVDGNDMVSSVIKSIKIIERPSP
jgi:hypothetical protein